MSAAQELLPCPFCGESAVASPGKKNLRYDAVGCINPRCRVAPLVKANRWNCDKLDDLVRAWNTRAGAKS